VAQSTCDGSSRLIAELSQGHYAALPRHIANRQLSDPDPTYGGGYMIVAVQDCTFIAARRRRVVAKPRCVIILRRAGPIIPAMTPITQPPTVEERLSPSRQPRSGFNDLMNAPGGFSLFALDIAGNPAEPPCLVR
jgi:hypothetical protein